MECIKKKKKTKRDLFNEVLVLVEGNEELTNFVNHELELLDKKANRTGTTKVQKENAELVEKIYNAMVEIAEPVTISELQEKVDFVADLSNQKVSALLKKLVDAGRVARTKDKKVTKRPTGGHDLCLNLYCLPTPPPT